MQRILALVQGPLIRAWRRRWQALAIAWAICLAGWMAIPYLPVAYQSSVDIEASPDLVLRSLLRGALVEPDVPARVARETDFDIIRAAITDATNIRQAILSASGRGPAVADMEAAIANVRNRIGIEFQPDNQIRLTYTAPVPEEAQQMAQAIASVFVGTNLRPRSEELAAAEAFLTDQIRSLEEARRIKEEELTRFSIENRGFVPGEDGYRARLDRAHNDLIQARATAEQMQILVNALESHLNSIPGAGNPRIAALESQLEDLLTRYTERHPDVVITRRLLEQERLNPSKAAGAPASPAGAPGGEAGPSGQTRLELAQATASLQAARRRIETIEKTIAELTALVSKAPPIEAEYARLTQELTIIRNSLSGMVERRERVRMTEEMNSKASPVQLRIVRPASPGTAPLWTDPRLLHTVVLLIGLVIGASTILGLALASNTVDSAEQAETLLDLPVVACVSAVELPRDRRRRLIGHVGFSTALAMLMAIYAGVLTGAGADLLAQIAALPIRA